jgi:3-phosphoshikimate 1-carboxyvinyltransferase
MAEPLTLVAAGPLRGRVRVPGDKSISHRALMLAALAEGESRITGLLEGEDVLATAAALRAMGAEIAREGDGEWRVRGLGSAPLRSPAAALDMGNSGTSTRLLMGLAAGQGVTATFTGDASLSRRPMGRVIEPLSRMGAQFEGPAGDRLPLTVRGASPVIPITYRLPVASAQVKSAVLLAGLATPGVTRVIEPVPTRDHSERMLAGFGAAITVGQDANGARVIELAGGGTPLWAQRIAVPGDPSSAAFPVVAALLVPGSDVVIENVGLNPTRAALFAALRRMGGDVAELNPRTVGGEPVADLRVRASALNTAEIVPEEVPAMVDEFPILFVACALARGRSVLTGLDELRVKESDRIAVMAQGLVAAGARVEELPDGLAIEGSGGDPLPGHATVATRLDHRIAMSFAIASLVCRKSIRVDDRAAINTSFPGFTALMEALGAAEAAEAAR